MKNVCLYQHSLKPIGKIECIEDRHSNIEYIRVYGKYENADILPILRCTQPCFTDEQPAHYCITFRPPDQLFINFDRIRTYSQPIVDVTQAVQCQPTQPYMYSIDRIKSTQIQSMCKSDGAGRTVSYTFMQFIKWFQGLNYF